MTMIIIIIINIIIISAFEILTSNPTGERPSGKPRRRWDDNIRMDLKEMGVIRGIRLILLRIEIIGEPL